jgi:hypothetical protein
MGRILAIRLPPRIGTLVRNMYEINDKRLIWRGTAEDAFSPETRKE